MEKQTNYKGSERRKFVRLDYLTPLAYKVCKKSTITKILKGYTSNISRSGLLCNIRDKVKKNDILWISFNRDMLSVCTDLEASSMIYQNGIIGKVIRTQHKRNGSYDVGIQFITREEKNLSNIYPKVYFLEKQQITK